MAQIRLATETAQEIVARGAGALVSDPEIFHVCSVSDIIIAVELVRTHGEDNELLQSIRTRSSRFDEAVQTGALFVCGLDGYWLTQTLFQDEDPASFWLEAVSETISPQKSLFLLSLRQMDISFGTNFVSEYLFD